MAAIDTCTSFGPQTLLAKGTLNGSFHKDLLLSFHGRSDIISDAGE